MKPPTRIKNTSFTGDVSIKWFEDGTLNASAYCLDRHLATRGDQTAIIWEGDDPKVSKHITYRELHEQVCRLANALKSLGVKKGDRVTHLPADGAGGGGRHAGLRAHRRDPFGGVRRVLARQPRQPHPGLRLRLLITADEGRRGGRSVPLKANVDAALKACPGVKQRASW